MWGIPAHPARYGLLGSAVVGFRHNSSGWGQDGPPLVAAFTSTGRGEVLYSLDKGRSGTRPLEEPGAGMRGDPRLLWHAPSAHWIMAVYQEETQAGRRSLAASSPSVAPPTGASGSIAARLRALGECPKCLNWRRRREPVAEQSSAHRPHTGCSAAPMGATCWGILMAPISSPRASCRLTRDGACMRLKPSAIARTDAGC